MRRYRFVVVALIPAVAALPWHHSGFLPPSVAYAAVVPDACKLLTEAEVSAALEVKSLAGSHIVESSTKMCGWSDVPGSDINHRRVVISIIPVAGFEFTKSRVGKTITIEPAAGIGDEAFYQILKTSESPMLVVRKGTSAFTLRLLNGLKLKAFTLAEEKAKEAALAKAAASRL